MASRFHADLTSKMQVLEAVYDETAQAAMTLARKIHTQLNANGKVTDQVLKRHLKQKSDAGEGE